MSFKYAVVLTGGIATGKSTVVKLLSDKGFRVIDADKIAHKVLDEQHSKISEMFGEEYVKEGKVDRVLLGRIVFADAAKRKVLESLLHPLIYDKIAKDSEALEKRSEPYIVDIPLYYEGGRYAIDKVIVVYATKKQQLERLMKRDGYEKEEALARIEAQIDIEEKREHASYLINNTTTLINLTQDTERVIEEILGDFQ